MPRSRGQSGKQRAKHVELEEAAERPVRARFFDEYQFACWWWRLVMNSWDIEMRLYDDIWSTQEVLELGLRVDSGGEYALGRRGPRLGDDRAPWGHYAMLERVRRRGLCLPGWMPGFDVVPWPHPPPGFRGGLAQLLPRSGVYLRIKQLASGEFQLRLNLFSVVGHAMLGPDVVEWGWSGVGEAQEEVEERRRAAEAAKFRTMALETDFYDLGSCSDSGSSEESVGEAGY